MLLRCVMHWLLWVVTVTSASTSPAQQEGDPPNWGEVVECFEKQGEVLCPGCNQRQGTSCPIYPPNDGFIYHKPSNSSTVQTTTLSSDKVDPTQTTTVLAKDEEADDIDNEIVRWSTTPSDETTFPTDATSLEDSETTPMVIDPRLYRYLLQHFYRTFPMGKRVKRRAMDSDGCGWVGDCPCPLLCCDRADGSGKECVMGIKRHPHFPKG